ncbi:MAG TPA: TolC family protein [Candidatus Baltobacteraceae bacterium]|jgi:outer membrane protein
MIAAATLAAALSLADVERAALARSPGVAQARAVVREKRALVAAATGSGAPQAFASYAQAPQSGGTGTIVQHLTTAGAQVALGDIAGRAPAIAQAQADLRAAESDLLGAERTERIAGITLYVDALRARDVRALRDAIVATGKADDRAAKLRFAAGDAPRLDVVRADVALTRDTADAASARADEANAVHALAVEMGVADDAVALPASPSDPVATMPASADQAVAIALAHRSELAGDRAALAAEDAAIVAARRGGLPSLVAQAGWATGTDSGRNVSGPSATVTLALPISNAAGARVDAERARRDQAAARLDGDEQRIRVEVAAGWRTAIAARAAALAADRALAEAAAEVRAVQSGYRDGASSSLDLSDARRTYAQVAIDRLGAVGDARRTAALFLESLGVPSP